MGEVRLSDGARLWTASRVRAGCPPVVLLHGGPGMWDYLEPVADLLGGASTCRFDQRGCGRSSPVGEYGLGRCLADIDELRAHFGFERWSVFGHSFGAGLGLAYAAAYPGRVDALVYCGGVGLDWPRHRSAFEVRARERRTVEQQAELEELSGSGGSRSWGEEVRWRALSWLPDFVPGDSAWAAAWAAAGVELPLNLDCNRALWPQISQRGLAVELAECAAVGVPVTVVHGDADPRPVGPVAALVDALPDGRLRVVEGAGHQPWVEQPVAFREVVRAGLGLPSADRS